MQNKYLNISPSRVDLIIKNLGEEIVGRSVIEFGAASGETLRDLHFDYRCKVQNYDILPVDMGFCKSSYFNLDELNFETIESNLLSSDVVLFLDVLEHVKHPKEVIETILDINPRVTIFIVSPNFASVRMLIAWIQGCLPERPNGFYDKTHIKWLSATWLSNNLDVQKYSIKSFQVFSKKPHLKFLQLMLPHRLCSQFGAVIRRCN